jgi:hypothetical protein
MVDLSSVEDFLDHIPLEDFLDSEVPLILDLVFPDPHSLSSKERETSGSKLSGPEGVEEGFSVVVVVKGGSLGDESFPDHLFVVSVGYRRC